MIIVRHPVSGGATAAGQQPQSLQQQQQQMLVVSGGGGATNNQQQQQQMQLLQQHNTRLSSSLGRGASLATAPSPRPPTGFMSPPPRNPLHTPLSGTVLSGPATSSMDQSLTLAQQAQHAISYGLNLDLTGLSTNPLVRSDGDVTPLTPQDQLSRYVDQL